MALLHTVLAIVLSVSMWGTIMPLHLMAVAVPVEVTLPAGLTSLSGVQPAHLLAQGGDLGKLGEKLARITSALQALGRPVASLALIMAVLMILFSKALPSTVQEQRGTIMSILVMIVVIGVLPDIVDWLWSLGGGGTT